MQQSLYIALGGELGIRQIVDSFYRLMDKLPEAAGIRKMHQDDLQSAREKLFEFLSGWTGGPQLFTEKYGHPMLRRRHLGFAIGKSERDQWMLCMLHALEENVVDEETRGIMLDSLMNLADHMRNQNP